MIMKNTVDATPAAILPPPRPNLIPLSPKRNPNVRDPRMSGLESQTGSEGAGSKEIINMSMSNRERHLSRFPTRERICRPCDEASESVGFMGWAKGGLTDPPRLCVTRPTANATCQNRSSDWIVRHASSATPTGPSVDCLSSASPLAACTIFHQQRLVWLWLLRLPPVSGLHQLAW